MKNYRISFRTGTKEMAKGNEPWNVESERDTDCFQEPIAAENAEVAIDYAIDWLTEQNNNAYEYETDREKNEIKLYDDDGDIIAVYYDFVANEVE